MLSNRIQYIISGTSIVIASVFGVALFSCGIGFTDCEISSDETNQVEFDKILP